MRLDAKIVNFSGKYFHFLMKNNIYMILLQK